MPTLVGARRRGFTPEGFRIFAERIGVSKADSWIDMSVLEDCMRDDLNARAPRRIAVLDPVRLVIDNYPEGKSEECFAPNHPQRPEWGKRALPFARELWIERDDYQEDPPKGYFRLAPGAEVRLRYAYIVRCVGADKDADGNVTTVHCTYDPATRSGTRRRRCAQGEGQHSLAVAPRTRCRPKCASTIACSRFRFPGRATRPARAADERRAGGGGRSRDGRRRRGRRRRRSSRSSATGSTISIRSPSAR